VRVRDILVPEVSGIRRHFRTSFIALVINVCVSCLFVRSPGLEMSATERGNITFYVLPNEYISQTLRTLDRLCGEAGMKKT
jgi:hypothetical protein